MSIFKDARAVATYCTDWKKRELLLARIEAARADYDILVVCASAVAAKNFVASTTRMLLAMEACAPIGDPNGNAGKMSLPVALDVERMHG